MKYNYSIKTGLKRVKTNAKKYVFSGLASIVMVGGMSMPVLAAGKAAPKATGGVGYTAYGLQRQASFGAHQQSSNCALGWNVNGTYTFNFVLDETSYLHDATISNQSGGAYDVAGGYPAGGTHTFAWSGTGNVSGSTVTNSVNYTVGAEGTHMDMTGTIAPGGTMSGTWSDNFGGGTRNGTWTTVSGAATQTSVEGCTGKGAFHYSDVNGNWYDVDVQYVKVSGNDTWFAGPVVDGNVGAGQWLFAKVRNGGTPGRNGDIIWGSFTTENAAKIGVATMSTPADGPFPVSSGNLQVHNK